MAVTLRIGEPVRAPFDELGPQGEPFRNRSFLEHTLPESNPRTSSTSGECSILSNASSTIFTRWNRLSTFRSALNRGRFCASPGVSGAVLGLRRFHQHVDERHPFEHGISPDTGLLLSPSPKHVDSTYLVHM